MLSGTVVEKQQGLSGKSSPGWESEAEGNPRAQPKCLPSKSPEAFRFSRADLFPDNTQALARFFQISQSLVS